MSAQLTRTRPFRIPRVRSVSPLPADLPYTAAELAADDETEVFRDRITLEFASDSPRRFKGRLFERATLQSILDNAANGLNDVSDPTGTTRFVPRTDIQTAIMSNVLNTPEKEHVRRSIERYEFRSARRQLHFDSRPLQPALQQRGASISLEEQDRRIREAEQMRQVQRVLDRRRQAGEDIGSDSESVVAEALREVDRQTYWLDNRPTSVAEAMDANWDDRIVEQREAQGLPALSTQERREQGLTMYDDYVEVVGAWPEVDSQGSDDVEVLDNPGTESSDDEVPTGAPDTRPILPSDLSVEGPPRQAFIRILLYIETAQDSWGAISYSRRTSFFREHNDRLYDRLTHGPWSTFRKASAQVSQRKFSAALERRKLVLREGSHSPDSGAAGEELPEDLVLIQRYLAWLENNPSTSARAEQRRGEHRAVERSLIGQQPPLGPAGQPLRTQTSGNNVAALPAEQAVMASGAPRAGNRNRPPAPTRENNRRPRPMPLSVSSRLPGAARQAEFERTSSTLAMSVTSFMTTVSQLQGPSPLEIADRIQRTCELRQNSTSDEERGVLSRMLLTLESELQASTARQRRIDERAEMWHRRMNEHLPSFSDESNNEES